MESLKASQIKQDSIIRYKGLFDLNDILKFLRGWMEDRNYSFYERKYKKKPDLKGFKYDITIESDKRINAYVKWFLIVRILVHDVEEKEVIENGVKKMKYLGRMKMKFDVRMQLDPDSRWEKPFFKKLEKFFVWDLSGPARWEMEMLWWDELYYDMYQMKEDLSRHMGLYYVG